MEEFLTKINLVQHTSVDLPVGRLNFIDLLYRNVDQGSTSFFANPFEMFSSSKNEYIGSINPNGFKIKRRRRLFDMNMGLAVSEGTLTETESGIHIAIKTSGLTSIMIPFYAFIVLFYSVALITMLLSENFDFTFLPFMCFHAMLMLGIPYFIMRRGARKMAYDLERDLFYMTRKLHNTINL